MINVGEVGGKLSSGGWATRLSTFYLDIDDLPLDLFGYSKFHARSSMSRLRFATVCPYIKVAWFIWGRLKRAESGGTQI